MGLDYSGKSTLAINLKNIYGKANININNILNDNEIIIPQQSLNLMKYKIYYTQNIFTIIDPPGKLEFREKWKLLLTNNINEIVYLIVFYYFD